MQFNFYFDKLKFIGIKVILRGKNKSDQKNQGEIVSRAENLALKRSAQRQINQIRGHARRGRGI